MLDKVTANVQLPTPKFELGPLQFIANILVRVDSVVGGRFAFIF